MEHFIKDEHYDNQTGKSRQRDFVTIAEVITIAVCAALMWALL